MALPEPLLNVTAPAVASTSRASLAIGVDAGFSHVKFDSSSTAS